MSDNRLRNGFALGLTIGVCLTTVFLIWGKGLYDYAVCLSQSTCDASGPFNSPSDVDANLQYWVRRLVKAEDTLAQWLITVLTTIAVILVWRTLIQTNRTNAAAIDAANAAREANMIMRNEQRPWLHISLTEGIIDSIDKDRNYIQFAGNLVIENTGFGPAYVDELRVIFTENNSFGWQIGIIKAIEAGEALPSTLLAVDISFPSMPTPIIGGISAPNVNFGGTKSENAPETNLYVWTVYRGSSGAAKYLTACAFNISPNYPVPIGPVKFQPLPLGLKYK